MTQSTVHLAPSQVYGMENQPPPPAPTQDTPVGPPREHWDPWGAETSSEAPLPVRPAMEAPVLGRLPPPPGPPPTYAPAATTPAPQPMAPTSTPASGPAAETAQVGIIDDMSGVQFSEHHQQWPAPPPGALPSAGGRGNLATSVEGDMEVDSVGGRGNLAAHQA